MSIGRRIGFFRFKRGMTQKYLGQQLGFPENSADVRIAQYEMDARTPKDDLLREIARVLDVSEKALKIPDVDNTEVFMHLLFAMEDYYGMRFVLKGNEFRVRFDPKRIDYWAVTFGGLHAWAKKQRELAEWKITQEEYDHWRHNYTKKDALSGGTSVYEKDGEIHYKFL